jgi:hypothetical protein
VHLDLEICLAVAATGKCQAKVLPFRQCPSNKPSPICLTMIADTPDSDRETFWLKGSRTRFATRGARQVPKFSQDRRAGERFDCHTRAAVLFGGRMIEGTIRSISENGARLHLSNVPFGLPKDLNLYVDGDATCYPVRVVWQSGERFGVIFSSAVRPKLEISLQS